MTEVCHYLNMTKKEFCLKGRIFTNTLKEAERALQGGCTAQKRLSEAEMEMDRQSWEREKFEGGEATFRVQPGVQFVFCF